jgi:hypothetical protein
VRFQVNTKSFNLDHIEQSKKKHTELPFQDASSRLNAANPSDFSPLLKSAKASATAHPIQSGIMQSYV